MKVISPRMHGYLDFLTVIVFLAAPILFELSRVPAMLAYSLAVIHLIVTLASDFPFGIVKIIPFTVHGWIERIVGPVLVAVPFVLGFANDEIARNFYIAVGIVIIIIGTLTDYRSAIKD